MDAGFTFDYRTNNGNLYLDLKGHYDESAAREVVSFLESAHNGGKIFISAFNVHELTEKGMNYFKNAMPKTSVSLPNLYLKGEKGSEMMPQGSRMLLLKEAVKDKINEKKSSCKCGGKCGGAETGHGKCKTCKCALKKRLLAQ